MKKSLIVGLFLVFVGALLVSVFHASPLAAHGLALHLPDASSPMLFGAAFATEAMNLTKQRVKIALADASPLAQAAFRRFFENISQQQRGRQLQLLAFTAADAAAAGGTVLGSGVLRVVAVYVKKTTAATQNTVKLYDDATDDTTAGNAIAAFDLRAASEEQLMFDPAGKVLATGLVVTAHTTVLGTTDGSSANAGSGFVILM